jgi:hypothetical protein
MEIHENHAAWVKAFQEGWLKKFQETGSLDWTMYVRPSNQMPITGPGINLSSSRLALISSTGGYLPASQAPYDASNPLGDYTLRLFPSDTPFDQLAFAHEHYDHTAVNADPQVLLPLVHLQDMVREGKIGALTSVVSLMGYQPDVSRVLHETIPAVLQAMKAEQADAALLVPA